MSNESGQDGGPQQTMVSIDTGQAPAAGAPGQGQLLAGKYKTAAELEAGYKELQAAFGRVTGGQAPAQQPIQQQQPVQTQLLDATALARLQTEFNTNGQLSPESLQILQRHNVDPNAALQMLASGAAGQSAVQSQYQSTVLGSVGGIQNYQAMAEWSKTGLTPQERDIYNAEVNSGDAARASFAAKSLLARMQQSRQSPVAGQIQGAPFSGAVEPPIGSMRELIEIQKTAKYKTDPGYREEILRRAALSPALNES